MATLISFVKDYTVTDFDNNGKEVLSFNIESFVIKLQSLRPYKFNPFEFHFTVGVNNAFFNTPLSLEDTPPIYNLSYVSEKIGLKYKIRDKAFWLNRNPGETYRIRNRNYIKSSAPKEPLVSNFHMLFYGSGLLYNLVNVKTSKEFNFPIVGLGLGLTFSNALDFNVTFGVPIVKTEEFSLKNNLINAGFDIQFSEYYNRLTEKRNANKTQKRLAEAIKK